MMKVFLQIVFPFSFFALALLSPLFFQRRCPDAPLTTESTSAKPTSTTTTGTTTAAFATTSTTLSTSASTSSRTSTIASATSSAVTTTTSTATSTTASTTVSTSMSTSAKPTVTSLSSALSTATRSSTTASMTTRAITSTTSTRASTTTLTTASMTASTSMSTAATTAATTTASTTSLLTTEAQEPDECQSCDCEKKQNCLVDFSGDNEENRKECRNRGCRWCENQNEEPTCIKGPKPEQDQCLLENKEKADCGYFGITKEECEKSNCCWQESFLFKYSRETDTPWCFYPNGFGY